VEFVNIFEDSLNPATNKLFLENTLKQEEHENLDEEEVRSERDGDQKFFLTAAAISE